MCLAIYKTAGGKIPSSHIVTASKANGDGFGMAVALGDKIHLVRSMKVDGILQTLERFKEYPAIIHLRMATHGEKNEANCHPFMVDDSTAFIHNGVLTIPTPEKQYSDTWHFANLLVRPNQRDTAGEWLWSGHASLNLHLLAGYSNKFCFLRADGKHLIVNEGAGHWDEERGVWYSNSSYKAFTYSSTSYYSGGYKGYKQTELGFRGVDSRLPSHYAGETAVSSDVMMSEDDDTEALFQEFLGDHLNAEAWCDWVESYGNKSDWKKWVRKNPAVSDSFLRWMTDPNDKGHYSSNRGFRVARKLYLDHWEEVEAQKFGATEYGVPDYAGSKFVTDNFGDDCDV